MRRRNVWLRGEVFTLAVMLGVIVFCGVGCRIPILMSPMIGEWEVKVSNDNNFEVGETIEFLSLGEMEGPFPLGNSSYHYSRIFHTLLIDPHITINGVRLTFHYDVEFYRDGLFCSGAKLTDWYNGDVVELELKSTPVLRQ